MFIATSRYWAAFAIALSFVFAPAALLRADPSPPALTLLVSPLYQPGFTSVDRLGSGNLMLYGLEAELATRNVFGLRYGKGTVPSLQAYQPSSFFTTYTSNASLTFLEMYMGVNLAINEPHGMLGPVQFFVPLQGGLAMLLLSTPADSYKAVGFDLATGLGARVYTLSFLRAEVSALYRFGIPVGTFINAASSDSVVQAPSSESMKLGLSGFELRFGVSFLFPGGPAATPATQEPPTPPTSPNPPVSAQSEEDTR